MGNATNSTPRTISLTAALAIAAVAFLVGAGVGVAAWITISGGSGEASIAAEDRAPQLSLSDATEEAAAVATTEEAPTEVPATDVPPTATPAPTEVAAQAETITRALYRIDSEQSEVRFLIDEDLQGQRITVVGKTNQVGGDIIVNFADPSASEVGVMVINSRTLETDNSFRNQALRSRILRSADPAYEFIEFTPKSLKGLPASVSEGETVTFQIIGDLKVIEVTREVTFDIALTLEDGQLRGTATTQILYEDFNITIPSVPGVANISDEVGLEMDFVATLVEAQ